MPLPDTQPDRVDCLAARKDKVWVGSGREILIYNERAQLEKRWDAHRDVVYCFAAFKDLMWSGSADETLKAWSPEGDMLVECEGHSVTSMARDDGHMEANRLRNKQGSSRWLCVYK
mmetsp:Transcript_1451/g.2937  ORF Transcript_1451/g.2937 Transcript_1451/m.2937 type:complete len:116 (-) Transcript_1451:60-407(-)